ncbi:cupin domain-containing protein [Desulfogranum japonicum]|uniref:cupin domain-containing protein n=1 Tax=Desulfogranum japonicum TaxID=231447 RepID=UPI00040D3C23|nr:cupin domain-containing protein [Desulfogranum japonicum]
MIVRKLEAVDTDAVPVGEGVSRKVLLSDQEAPNFAMRCFTIAPGGFMPMHTNSVEHEQFILGGTADVVVGEEKFQVSKDDAVLIPKGVPHCYTNNGSEPFVFLCLIPNEEDIVEIIDQP